MKTRSSSTENFDLWAEGARPGLLRLITPILGSRHEAEDVVQETLLALWKRQDKVNDWSAYAGRAAWLNALKRKGRRRAWVALEDAETAKGFPRALPPSVEAWELEQALATLPAAQQTVIRLRFYAGQSFQEIGEALEISLNTAASRARYALETLRKALHPSQPKKQKGGKRGKLGD